MYLEAILVLGQENADVHSVDVAAYLKVTKPSVSRAMSLLSEAGYLSLDASGCITLTDIGRAKAEDVYDRHVTLRSFLEQLGVSIEAADEDACRIEHIISDETLSHIKKHLNQ